MGKFVDIGYILEKIRETSYHIEEEAYKALNEMYKFREFGELGKFFAKEELLEPIEEIYKNIQDNSNKIEVWIQTWTQYLNEIIEEHNRIIKQISPPLVVHQDISLLISNAFLNYKKKKNEL